MLFFAPRFTFLSLRAEIRRARGMIGIVREVAIGAIAKMIGGRRARVCGGRSRGERRVVMREIPHTLTLLHERPVGKPDSEQPHPTAAGGGAAAASSTAGAGGASAGVVAVIGAMGAAPRHHSGGGERKL